MADIFKHVEEFGDNQPNAKKEAFAAYEAASARFKAEIRGMQTTEDMPWGDQARARLPAIMENLNILRKAVENAPGMLDGGEDCAFRSERGYWVRLWADIMPSWPPAPAPAPR